MDKARKSEQDWPENHAAFGIGGSGDTSPRLGRCKVAEGSCGGNLIKRPRGIMPR
jgi:hypothetical protein